MSRAVHEPGRRRRPGYLRSPGRAVPAALLLPLLWAPPTPQTPQGATQEGERPAAQAPRTRVVVLGTGTPNADPERWGPAVAVIVDDRAYLVDAGPGVVRRAAQAARDRQIPALAPSGLARVFLTHLHSDHTVGLPDLLLSPFVLDRPGPLHVHGPEGTERMVEHVMEAWQQDVRMRLFGLEPRTNTEAWMAVPHPVVEGVVHADELVTVRAFRVPHGSWPEAFAYRFEGPDRTVVISGDTGPDPDLMARACDGCDVLVHEVYSVERLATRPPEWQRYHRDSHTSTVELVEVARKARPGTLVLYHQLYWGATDEDLLREVREAGWTGPLFSAKDLDVY